MSTDAEPAAASAARSLPHEHSALETIFAPGNVAVVGASERAGGVGRSLMWNLIANPFGGAVFPVNPKRSAVLGVKAYASLREIPDAVDLAVVATPAPTVPDVIDACAEIGVKGAIILTAGFRETGQAGLELEARVLDRARHGGIRLIGPNCLGVMRPTTGLNATFAAGMARPGPIGFLSQSGALGTAILDWSLEHGVGFSTFVSLGAMLDVGWGDLIDYLGDDPHTKSIVLYIESIGDARAFVSAAREVALTKPIIALKAGRSSGAARAISSHTGAMAGADDVLDAALRRCGVLRVETLEELFATAELLGKQPRPKGPRLTVVTNAGGPGVLAADALAAGGGELAPLDQEMLAKLDALLPGAWSRGNPIDVLGDAGPKRFADAVSLAANDPSGDGLLAILTPQAMTDPTATAERAAQVTLPPDKPVLACWMGGEAVAAGRAILSLAGIPVYSYPETAAQAFCTMWRYSATLRLLYETPTLTADTPGAEPARVKGDAIVQAAHRTERSLLTEFEAKQLLNAYGIPVVETRIAANEDEAVAIAGEVGYPVVLKVHSESIVHKTESGGVFVRLADPEAVRRAFRAIRHAVSQRVGEGAFSGVTVQPFIEGGGYELIVGSAVDPQFGPVLLFGSGGILAEVFADRSIALPPINSTLARRLMERTRVFAALKGVRGRPPVDLPALESLLVKFGQLVVEQPWIREIEINPLFALSDRLVALDARALLHGQEVAEADLPRLSIRPFPAQYVGPWTLKDGTQVTIRPVRPEDEPLFVKFHATLSERSVFLRYFHLSKVSARVAHERLTRMCFIDYDREIALVAEHGAPNTGDREILGIARLQKIHTTDEAEFALIVSDRYQRQGLGVELMRRLVRVARDEGLRRVSADVLPENVAMQRLCASLGPATFASKGSVVRVSLDLSKVESAGPRNR